MSRDVEAGKAFVRVSLKGLDQASRRFKRWGASLAGIGTKIAGLGAVLSAPFVGAVKAASDMEEIMGKFNVVFGESAKEVKDWSDQTAGAMGRSKKQMAEFMASAKDLFTPLGFADKEGTELSKTVTQLAVDLASFNNKIDTDVMRDLQAALTGSGETVKKYGVVLNVAGVKQELLNKGLDPKNATNAQQAMARLNIILAGTTAAQGDAVRTGGSFANQMKRLQGRVDDMNVSLGTALLPTMRDLASRAVKIVSQIAEWAEKNEKMIKILALVAVGVTAAGVAIIALGGILSAVGTILATVSALLGALLSPIGLVVAAVVGLTAAFMDFSKIKQVVSDTFQGVRDAIKAGDWKLVGQIAWTGLKLAWYELIDDLRTKWIEFNRWFVDALLRMGEIATWGDLESQIRDYRKAVHEGFDADIQAGADRIRQLQEELAALKKKAAMEANARAAAEEDEAYRKTKQNQGAGAGGGGGVAAGRGQGTFSPYAASAMFYRGSSTEQQIEKNTRKMAGDIERIRKRETMVVPTFG